MGLFIRSLLVILIANAQVELQVEASRHQRTVSRDVDTNSKVDELRLIVENYLVILEDELRNTQDLVKELKVTMTDNHGTVSSELEDTRRTMGMFQAAISTNQETATSEQEETRRMVSELQAAISTNQETATSEQEETRRMVSELQVAISTNQETVTSEQEETRRMVSELQVAISTNQETATSEQKETRRMVSELQVAVSTNQETATSEQEETRRMVSELQAAISTNQETATSEQEETRRMVSELQAAVSTSRETVTSEQEETRRMVSELQVTISTNQEAANSEQEETRRVVSELQVAVTTNQQKVTVALRNTTLQLKDTRREIGVIGRQVEELQESVSMTKIHGVRDCSDVLARGGACSGVYAVKPDCGAPFDVYCDMETDGGGWTVFQRRQDGSVDFYLDFANYSRGFGNLEGESWLGNDNLHRLTAQGEYELRVDLTSFRDESRYAVYESFSIADVSDNYRLSLGSYSGTAGDMLSWHNNQAFSTKDRDNDPWSSVNCAERYHGAWWYRSCHRSNLNGRYFNEASTDREGIIWLYFSDYRSLKTTEMKIRRKV
ncbi:uncharacterized protein [Asterias amurensis]|uniref:uncharacterized protein n=1 Tax=Asterias amurensis TaxID=7602 RepID=UPI003AB7C5FA